MVQHAVFLLTLKFYPVMVAVLGIDCLDLRQTTTRCTQQHCAVVIIIIIIIMTRRQQRPVAMTLHGRGSVPS